MANKPTKSTGIFYPGFRRGRNQGAAPAERSMQTVSADRTKENSVIRRKQASNPLTEQSMRKPF